jgi:hypothetical protein
MPESAGTGHVQSPGEAGGQRDAIALEVAAANSIADGEP